MEEAWVAEYSGVALVLSEGDLVPLEGFLEDDLEGDSSNPGAQINISGQIPTRFVPSDRVGGLIKIIFGKL